MPAGLRSLAFLGLDLVLAWLWLALLESSGGRAAEGAEAGAAGEASPGTRWVLFLLLALLGSLTLSWVEAGPRPPAQALLLAGACAVVAAAAFSAGAVAGGTPRASEPFLLGASGVALALLGSAQGYFAGRWLPMAAALSRTGTGFLGAALAVGVPLVFAACLALTSAACLHVDFRGARVRVLAALLLLWAAPTALTEWRLRAAWGFGPESLAQAAGVPPAAAAPQVEVAVLRPSAGGAALRWERRSQAAEGVDASVASLERLSAYLQEHGRGVYARQAVAASRRGWLLWWDADRALAAAAWRAPPEVAPDLRTALALIAAGPLTAERFAELRRLQEQALASPAGFEDVNGSQLAFEAFSAAFARFGDEARAQYWLGRVGNLWPINEKKVEVTPLQDLREGRISGRLLIDGRPASSVRVGLFLETTSEVTKKTSFALGGSVLPDAAGDFEFAHLGSGIYHLELQGTPQQLRGAVWGSPGLIELTESAPAAYLEPIAIVRQAALPEPADAGAREWLRAEPQGLGGLLIPAKR